LNQPAQEICSPLIGRLSQIPTRILITLSDKGTHLVSGAGALGIVKLNQHFWGIPHSNPFAHLTNISKVNG
jgi:hypothetical protein